MSRNLILLIVLAALFLTACNPRYSEYPSRSGYCEWYMNDYHASGYIQNISNDYSGHYYRDGNHCCFTMRTTIGNINDCIKVQDDN